MQYPYIHNYFKLILRIAPEWLDLTPLQGVGTYSAKSHSSPTVETNASSSATSSISSG